MYIPIVNCKYICKNVNVVVLVARGLCRMLLLYDLFNRHNSMTTVLMLSDVRVVYE